MNRKMLTVTSLFSGAGGLDLGFEWQGFNILWASDLNKDATDSYLRNFGRPAWQCDISDLSADAIPDADVIIGGPPCQSFSLVGQRKPDDPRGKLVFEFLRIVREKQPLAFVMENVPGMAASTINVITLPRISQATLAEMIGTTRSRVSFFMNRFRKMGFIEYKGAIKVHKSLLNVILADHLHHPSVEKHSLDA